MAESLAPIDESVKIPDAVKAAAARAEAHYATPPEPSAEQPPEPPQAATPEPAPTPEPPAPAPTPPPQTPDEISALKAELAKQQRDYNALLGRNAQQRDYIAMQQTQLASLSNPRSWATPENKPLISDEERKNYGDELLSVIERKAKEALSPEVRSLAEQNQKLQRELTKVKANDVYSELDTKLPNWEQINDNPAWVNWLSLPDVYSGVVRQGLLDAAFAAGDSGRILAFFRGFQADHPEHMGQQSPAAPPAPPSPTPVRKAALKLETLAAPGRASPSPSAAATSEAPLITNKDVAQFYRDVTHGRYAGREEAKAAREAQIHAAVRDGRVQIVK
jgi:hypothetical protein